MPLIMQLERHLTNQGIQFSTDNALLWPESRAAHTLHFWGIPLSYHLAIPPFGCIRAWWLKKKDIPQPARPKCAPFVSLQNPTYRCQDAGRYVGRSLGFSFHMVGGRHWKWILDEQLFSVAASPWWSASGWSFILAWNCRVANLKDSVSSRTESRQ